MSLAIKGGEPVRKVPFPWHNVIGDDEKLAVMRVLESGILSQYLGCWHKDFYGGPEVQALESEWAEHFGVKHAIAVNSCTSGLCCAVGATGLEPGDEVVVSPYTMTASATAVLVFNGIPVFADVEKDFFCIDPDSFESKITDRTRAIVVVDIFGQPYDRDRINQIARKHGLLVIEDAAQAPGARLNGRWAGTLGDIGVYSLNYHKHIHCGEGGMVVTNDDNLANKVRLIRNHGEAVVKGMGFDDLVNVIGFNFRLPEMEAAITRSLLPKLDSLLDERRKNCEWLSRRLESVGCIQPAQVRPGAEHAYYVHPFLFDEASAGVSRNVFINAVKAELAPSVGREQLGVSIGCGYVEPLYLQPIYQRKIAYGSRGFPFVSPWTDREVNYSKGICPVVESLHETTFFSHELMYPGMKSDDLEDVALAFEKVWCLRNEL
jgi:dTDP-4-amino-4,6-dideoxygalactose transaminase